MKYINTILVALLVAAANAFADIKVSDVQVFSGYPWQEVVVGYTISGSAKEPVKVWLSATDKTNNKTYSASVLSGAETGPGRHVMKWNASGDGVRFKSDNVVFTVGVREWLLYCIVDLSGGVNAKSYPVTYMNAIPGGAWAEEYKTTKLVLRRIEAGSYKMLNRGDVTLTKPFYIGVFEVTQKQWELVMGANPVHFYGIGDSYPVYYLSYNMIRGSSYGARWPWTSDVDATSFVGKLQSKTGINFDLPTEAQWEYAYRAGTTTRYYWGDAMDCDFAWCYNNSGFSSHPVGEKLPNAWGLYDMSGNVWEWTLDWYDDGYALMYGEDPKGPYSGGGRVLRGGCWNGKSSRYYCDSYLRLGDNPNSNASSGAAGNEYGAYGFRLSRTLP